MLCGFKAAVELRHFSYTRHPKKRKNNLTARNFHTFFMTFEDLLFDPSDLVIIDNGQ